MKRSVGKAKCHIKKQTSVGIKQRSIYKSKEVLEKQNKCWHKANNKYWKSKQVLKMKRSIDIKQTTSIGIKQKKCLKKSKVFKKANKW